MMQMIELARDSCVCGLEQCDGDGGNNVVWNMAVGLGGWCIWSALDALLAHPLRAAAIASSCSISLRMAAFRICFASDFDLAAASTTFWVVCEYSHCV